MSESAAAAAGLPAVPPEENRDEDDGSLVGYARSLQVDVDRLAASSVAAEARAEAALANDALHEAARERLVDERNIAHAVAAEARARVAQLEARALDAIAAVPHRSGTPEWSKGAAVAQAAGFDVGLAVASDAVRAALAAAPVPLVEDVPTEERRSE